MSTLEKWNQIKEINYFPIYAKNLENEMLCVPQGE